MDIFKANGSGNGTVTTHGVPVQLPMINCSRGLITASDNNGNLIAVGDQSVSAANRIGALLQPSFSQWFYLSSLNQLYIDALDNGASFSYYYEIGH